MPESCSAQCDVPVTEKFLERTRIHPRIRSGQIVAPGFYALKLPPMTAVGFLVLHLVFGVIVGALYGVWAG